MLSTMRSSWLLFTLLAIIALAQAFSVEDALNIDGINAYLHHGMKRQAEGTAASSSTAAPAPSTSSEPEPEPSDTPTSPPAPTPTPPAPSDESTSDERTSTSAQAPPSRSSTPPPPTASATEQAPPSRTSSSTRVSTPIVTDRPLVSLEVAPTTTVITLISDGQTRESTSVGSTTIEHTTGSVRETLLPGPASSGGGGLSSTNKSIIGGVVGGVGGAILLGGIALVCWRMWGRKKRISEDDDDLMANTGAALGDKSQNNASPFQANLEQYHNPGGRPNAAANF